MKLTRRDLVAALAAAGVAVGGGGAVLLSGNGSNTDESSGPLASDQVTTLVAAAEALYPSDVENVDSFVTEYVRGREDERPAYARQMGEAAHYLDEYADSWYDEQFPALSQSDRAEAFRRMNADTADPVPDGSDVERVRYYVVNELLFAFYSTPTGGELVGLENPLGYPGGTDSYRRGPQP